MTAFLAKASPYALYVLTGCLAVAILIGMVFLPWQAAWMALLADPMMVLYLVPCAIALLLLLAWLCGRLAAWQQAEHHARVAAILGVIGRKAATIAQTLERSPPTAAGLPGAVKAALIADTVAYVQSAMPGFVASTGYTPQKLLNAVTGSVDQAQLPNLITSAMQDALPALVAGVTQQASAAASPPAAPPAAAAG